MNAQTERRQRKGTKEITVVTFKSEDEDWLLPYQLNPLTGWKNEDGSVSVLCYGYRRVSA